MFTTKTSLKKQLFGAVAGAAVALVVYQSYTFTSDHLSALVTLPVGSGIAGGAMVQPQYVRPTVTTGSPVVNTSPSSVTSSAMSSVMSSSAPTVIQRRPWTPPVGGLPAGTQEIVLQEQKVPMITSAHPQGALPKSGFGLDVIALMAFGAVIGRKKLKHA